MATVPARISSTSIKTNINAQMREFTDLEVIIINKAAVLTVRCGVFFLYVNIVSHLNYDGSIDNDDESYECDLL